MNKATPRDQLGFSSMAELIPEFESGNVRVRHVVLDKDRVKNGQFRAIISGHSWTHYGLVPGKYAVLDVDGAVMMSDTWLERMSNQEFVEKANGHVLMGGLGLGMCVVRLTAKPEVESLTVIECDPDVIKLIEPHVRHPKLTVIEADVFTWETRRKFDVIYMDIWPEICPDNLPEMVKLTRRYQHRVNRDNPDRWHSAWLKEHLRAERRREQRNGW